MAHNRTCTFCDKRINPASDYRRVTGWERRRDTGGTNALRLRQPEEVWACFECIDSRARARVPEGQGSLMAPVM